MTNPPRLIPVLLLEGQRLVKTVRFKAPTYIGDPRNAVRIFSEREVDELVLLDISATAQNSRPQFTLIAEIVSEAFAPIAYGGGVRTLEDARTILSLGVEKIVINTAAIDTPQLVSEMSAAFGAQSVVVCMDVKKGLLRGEQVYGRSGRQPSGVDVATFANRMVALGAGELIVHSIDRDGTMSGYDWDLVKLVASSVRVPVVALGGAGELQHAAVAVQSCGAAAAAAGSLFVFHGPHRAVLISYPDRHVLDRIFSS